MSDAQQIMLVLTFVLGCAATFTSLGLVVYFQKAHRRIGRALSFMLFGEFCAMLVTTCFAFAELTGSGYGFSPEINSVMRIIMLGVTMASSLHLAWAVSKI